LELRQTKPEHQLLVVEDDFVQKALDIERQADGGVKFMANFDRSGSIMGNGGHRIKEIRNMSRAFVNIDDPAPDSTLREVTIARGQGNEMSVDNAVWLMNIAINAFCDPSGSACPFPATASMQEVVMSGFYGKPPGMTAGGQGGLGMVSSPVQSAVPTWGQPAAPVASAPRTGRRHAVATRTARTRRRRRLGVG